jgi:2-(1,2-epoxy-1,2-dihydrophenyl)acetyl-CoA isomerase
MIRPLVERLYAALAAGDRAEVETLLDPSFTASFSEGLPHGIGGRHDGTDAIDRGWWAIGRAFQLRARPDELVETVDGRLLVLGRYVGQARASGAPVDAAFAHLWSGDGARLTALVQITDTARWAE